MDDIGNNVGMVTVLGMGTVFVCLILLYGVTLILGRMLAKPKPVAAEAAGEPSDADAIAAAPEPVVDDNESILAAMLLVLARHRAARLQPADATSASDPWKMAGRIRMLRNE